MEAAGEAQEALSATRRRSRVVQELKQERGFLCAVCACACEARQLKWIIQEVTLGSIEPAPPGRRCDRCRALP